MSDKPNCEIARRERDAAQSENAKLRRVLKAAVELVCSTGWAGVSDEDVVLERTLRECGFVAPNARLEPRGNRVGSEPLLGDNGGAK